MRSAQLGSHTKENAKSQAQRKAAYLASYALRNRDRDSENDDLLEWQGRWGPRV